LFCGGCAEVADVGKNTIEIIEENAGSYAEVGSPY
jgi:hypothetical protein